MYKPRICWPTLKPSFRGSSGLCGKGALKRSTNPSIQVMFGFLLKVPCATHVRITINPLHSHGHWGCLV